MVGKATPGRRGPQDPQWVLETHWWQDLVEKPALSRKLSPRASGWASEERKRHNADGHKSGGQYIAVFVRSPAPSHRKTLSNPFRTLAIKWEVYFLKKLRSFFIIVSLWFFLHESAYDHITIGNEHDDPS